MFQGAILIVEDDGQVQKLIIGFAVKAGFREFHVAATPEDALALFSAHRGEIIGVIVDGCLNREGHPDGSGVIQSLREAGFSGPIVGASGSDDMNNILMEVGATGKVRASNYRGDKSTAPRVLADLLRKQGIEG